VGPKTTHSWLLTCALSLALAQPCVSSSQVIDHISEQYEAFFKSLNMQPTMVPFIREKASTGDARAQPTLGLMYFVGQLVDKDRALGLQWVTKAANQGLASAQQTIGLMYSIATDVPNNYGHAREWLQKPSQQDNPTALNALGVLHWQGRGGEVDGAQAIRYLKKAADGGFADAQSNLGILYHEGKVTPQDLGEALKGLRLAAFQNQPRAVYVLGVMYRDGRSVPKDEGEAVRLFKRDAEELRYPPAENTLGSLYYLGRGVPKDLVLAYMWESVAIDAGYEPARKALQTMSDGMTAEQISEAIQRSHEWMNSPPTVAGSPSVAAATIETNP
jgi:TPR repeat protein